MAYDIYIDLFRIHSVTLACDTTDDLTAAMSHVNVVPAEFISPYLGLGKVGVCGSVLQQGGWGLFPLNL